MDRGEGGLSRGRIRYAAGEPGCRRCRVAREEFIIYFFIPLLRFLFMTEWLTGWLVGWVGSWLELIGGGGGWEWVYFSSLLCRLNGGVLSPSTIHHQHSSELEYFIRAWKDIYAIHTGLGSKFIIICGCVESISWFYSIPAPAFYFRVARDETPSSSLFLFHPILSYVDIHSLPASARLCLVSFEVEGALLPRISCRKWWKVLACFLCLRNPYYCIPWDSSPGFFHLDFHLSLCLSRGHLMRWNSTLIVLLPVIILN